MLQSLFTGRSVNFKALISRRRKSTINTFEVGSFCLVRSRLMMRQVIVVVKRASTDVTDEFFNVKVNIQMLRESAFRRISVLTVTAGINSVFVSIDVSSQNRWMTE